jgi:hypothetical protein
MFCSEIRLGSAKKQNVRKDERKGVVLPPEIGWAIRSKSIK